MNIFAVEKGRIVCRFEMKPCSAQAELVPNFLRHAAYHEHGPCSTSSGRVLRQPTPAMARRVVCQACPQHQRFAAAVKKNSHTPSAPWSGRNRGPAHTPARLPRRIALPRLPGLARFSSPHRLHHRIPSGSSKSGTSSDMPPPSEPVTVCPCNCTHPANDAIAVPQIPINVWCFASTLQCSSTNQSALSTYSLRNSASCGIHDACSAPTPNGNVTLLSDTCR